ncbi:MAG: response regulator, partial [Thermoanaerobaculia bacterium]|nr:response regulator [Thermoanaerobaculia bacterium]
QEVQPRVLDLNTVLRDLEKLLDRLIGEDVRMETARPSAETPVLADPVQIEQVVINLATNARDAMPRGGTLSLELSRVTVSQPVVGATGRLEPGTYALLSVSDTGQGMDDETARKAFDPFFTTKEPGKGTGLGLSTVYGIVEQSGGSVSIVSSPGHGTTVKVYFPIASGTPSEIASPRRPVSSREGGSETLLVAEDEPAVSALIVSALEARGYRVLLAGDGARALEVWRRHEDEIDMILSDVVMPDVGGVELVRTLRGEGCRLPVLFVSGHTDDTLGELEVLEEEIDLLEKPFDPDRLVSRVRSALDRSDPAEAADSE